MKSSSLFSILLPINKFKNVFFIYLLLNRHDVLVWYTDYFTVFHHCHADFLII